MVIVAAIVFPVIAGAKEKARQSVCISQLKQFATAISLYAGDYPGYEPLHPAVDIPVTVLSKPFVLRSYLKDRAVYYCPDTPSCAQFKLG
jgi:type II secretory pathway pseudopilin PulG